MFKFLDSFFKKKEPEVPHEEEEEEEEEEDDLKLKKADIIEHQRDLRRKYIEEYDFSEFPDAKCFTSETSDPSKDVILFVDDDESVTEIIIPSIVRYFKTVETEGKKLIDKYDIYLADGREAACIGLKYIKNFDRPDRTIHCVLDISLGYGLKSTHTEILDIRLDGIDLAILSQTLWKDRSKHIFLSGHVLNSKSEIIVEAKEKYNQFFEHENFDSHFLSKTDGGTGSLKKSIRDFVGF